MRPPAEPSDADTDRETAPNELARFMPAPAPVATPAPVPDVLRTRPFPLCPELVRCRGACCQEAERSCPEGVRDTPLRSETTLPGPPPPPAAGLAKLPELVRSSWPAGGRGPTLCELVCRDRWQAAFVAFVRPKTSINLLKALEGTLSAHMVVLRLPLAGCMQQPGSEGKGPAWA